MLRKLQSVPAGAPSQAGCQRVRRTISCEWRPFGLCQLNDGAAASTRLPTSGVVRCEMQLIETGKTMRSCVSQTSVRPDHNPRNAHTSLSFKQLGSNPFYQTPVNVVTVHYVRNMRRRHAWARKRLLTLLVPCFCSPGTGVRRR